MALRKQPRSIARELALLSISQIKTKKGKLAQEDLDSLVLAAIRTLTIEVQDNLEAASAEIKRGEERILNSETRASDLNSARVMIQEALSVSQTAVNRLGIAVEFPEFLQLTNQEQVRQYATEIIATVNEYRQEIEAAIENVLVAWQLSRLAKIDRDILRIAVAEIIYLEVPERVAINESVELAKRYSDEDGFRFINGVLRRLSDRLKESTAQSTSKIEAPEKVEATAIVEDTEIGKQIEATEINNLAEQNNQTLPILKQTFINQE
ncbi:MAG TPA: transcription antitermination factor NusB [Coleofasciculaceae cyanobacterium]|jgi:N utilization substance protein B